MAAGPDTGGRKPGAAKVGLPAARPDGLTPTDKLAALLEAHGYSKTDIAEQLNVSPTTVARLRRNEDYKAEVARQTARAGEKLAPLLERMQSEVLGSMSAGLDALRELLTAEDDAGNPLYGVRHDAAVKLVETGIKIVQPALVGPGSGGAPAGGGTAASRTSITFNIKPGGEVTVDASADDVTEATEA